MTSIAALRALPLSLFDDDRLIDEWRSSPFASMGDTALIEMCIDAIATPKTTLTPNSFLLHAPLELLARAALLPRVELNRREEARRRIAGIAVRYGHAGDEVQQLELPFDDNETAMQSLSSAMSNGDQRIVDAALTHLAQRQSLAVIATTLFDPVMTSLGAAGHAPILLAELQRVAGRYGNAATLLRAPLRYLLIHPAARWHWYEQRSVPIKSDAHEAQTLARVLAKPESVSVANQSISTQFTAVASTGNLARDLGAFAFTDTNIIEKALLRAAAHSMLQDDAKHAAYGWTHCLTMPLALLTNARISQNPSGAVAMASAEIYAFRATMSGIALDYQWIPEPPRHRELAIATPQEAASIAFHATVHSRRGLHSELATFAATHRDAHLAKYTLACFDAAACDPECSSLYFAAAAYLGAWWRERDLARS